MICDDEPTDAHLHRKKGRERDVRGLSYSDNRQLTTDNRLRIDGHIDGIGWLAGVGVVFSELDADQGATVGLDSDFLKGKRIIAQGVVKRNPGFPGHHVSLPEREQHRGVGVAPLQGAKRRGRRFVEFHPGLLSS